MKRILLILILAGMSLHSAYAQLDRSQRPAPGPAPVIRLGDFESFTLNNGLQVIVVENRNVPVVTIQLSLTNDPVMEGDAVGYVEMAGMLMREGTINRSKEQIDESIDFIGASLSTSSGGMFASSLSRHTETLLEIMSDVLLNPTFPLAELDRRITQSKSGLATVRNDANAIARNVGLVAVYGTDHPYGQISTVESLDNITRSMLVDYYNTYFKPNVAYLVIVGDIDVDRARILSEKYFGNWKKGDVPTHTYPTPKAPEGRRVAFAERPGAIQSVVNVTYPVLFSPGNPDAIKASVMNSILGGGVFSGRLMQNLREDKGYTYGARSSLSSDRLIGRFTASTEVRNSVTDSTVVEILGEMQRLINEPVDETTLELVKNFMNGNFARSLESPRTVAGFALNIKRFNLPEDYYATYLEKLSQVSSADVQAMAAKYLKPDNAIIVVAGNKDEVVPQLTKFSASGQVELYDAFGRPLVEQTIETDAEMTAEKVIEAYIAAKGGRSKMENVNDLSQVITLSVMGQQATVRSFQKRPHFLLVKTEMGGMTLSQQLFDGKKFAIASPMGSQEFTEGPPFEQGRMQSVLFPELNFASMGVSMKLMGAESLDGVNVYRVEVTDPSGNKTNEYYNMETGLKIRSVSEGGIATYSDYKEVNGIKFPHKIVQEAGPQVIEMKVVETKVNSGLKEDIFRIQ